MKWYQTYLLHPGLDLIEVMIFQHLYWPLNRAAGQREVTGCNKLLCTKRFKNSKFPAKLVDKTLWNKLCVDIIGSNKIHKKWKGPLILK